MSKHFGNAFYWNSFGQHNCSESMASAMCGQLLLNSTQISNFFEIAVESDFRTLYQIVRKSLFSRGNDLVTVLLTRVYIVLHTWDNSWYKYTKHSLFVAEKMWIKILDVLPYFLINIVTLHIRGKQVNPHKSADAVVYIVWKNTLFFFSCCLSLLQAD